MNNDQTECVECGEEFPTSFSNSITGGDTELIVHDGELSAIIEFECPYCHAELILEDARGPSYGINPR